MGKKTCGNHHIDPPRLVNSCDSCLILFWRPTVSHKSEEKFRVKTRDRIKPAELGLFGLFFIQQFHLSYCPIRKKTPRVCHRMIDENSSSIYRYIDIDIYIERYRYMYPGSPRRNKEKPLGWSMYQGFPILLRGKVWSNWTSCLYKWWISGYSNILPPTWNYQVVGWIYGQIVRHHQPEKGWLFLVGFTFQTLHDTSPTYLMKSIQSKGLDI